MNEDYVVMFSGSRSFYLRHLIHQKIMELKQIWGDRLVIWTGGAKGADEIAEDVARYMHVRVLPSRLPDYERWGGKMAPIIRNKEMVEDPRVKEVVCFWNGVSPGTESVIRHCQVVFKNFSVIFDKMTGGDIQ